MVNHIFSNILRSEINNVIETFPATMFEDLNVEIVDGILLDSIHLLIDSLFSYSTHSEGIWRMIVKQVKKVYDIVISKEDIFPGFLLGGIYCLI